MQRVLLVLAVASALLLTIAPAALAIGEPILPWTARR